MPDPAPNPPRFRWLKRLALLCAVALVGLALLRVYWGHREQSQLDQLVEAARDKGYPVYFDDLQPPKLGTQENRATYIDAALRSIPYANAQNEFIDDTDWYNEGGADYFDEHQLPDPVADNAVYLAQFQPVLDAVRQAEQLTHSDWTRGQPITRPAFDMLLPQLGECRRLARVIEDAIWRAMDEQNYPLALDMLGDLMTITDALRDDRYYGLLHHLVAISIRALAADAVQCMLPQLPDDPAFASRLETLNQRWLDEDWAEHGLSQAYQTELWGVYDYIEGVIDGRFSYGNYFGYTPDHLLPLEFGPSRWLLRPYYQSDLAFIVRYFTALIDAADGCTNLQAFEDRLDQAGVTAMTDALDSASAGFPIEFPLSYDSIWTSDSIPRTHCRHLATARMCATAIALKRYAIDHGQPPDTLAQLVPDYLDAVPDDPTVLNRKITYLPGGASPVLDAGYGYTSNTPTPHPEVTRRLTLSFPLLYCVGEDRNDDGGLFPIKDNSGRIDGWFNGQDGSTDWCFFLTELPKPIPDPNVLPFNQRNSYGGSSSRGLGLPGARPTPPGNTQPAPQGDSTDPDSAGEDEQVDEQDHGGQGNEDEQPPSQPEQRDP